MPNQRSPTAADGLIEAIQEVATSLRDAVKQ